MGRKHGLACQIGLHFFQTLFASVPNAISTHCVARGTPRDCAGHTADVLVGLEPLNPQAWEKSCSAAFMSPPTIRGQA